MDCILQRDDSLDDFLTSWRKYSTAVIAFAESHKSHKELKKCLRAIVDDEEEVESDACSECLHCRCILCTLFLFICRLSHCSKMPWLLPE